MGLQKSFHCQIPCLNLFLIIGNAVIHLAGVSGLCAMSLFEVSFTAVTRVELRDFFRRQSGIEETKGTTRALCQRTAERRCPKCVASQKRSHNGWDKGQILRSATRAS